MGHAITLTIPPWLLIAEKEFGVEEIPGPNHEKRIVEYHKTTDLKANDDETPWCSSFVNFCVEQSGLVGTKKAWARSWLMWGNKMTVPAFGCVTVLSRNNNPNQGHVGFFLGFGRRETDSSSTFLLLGGNQGNKVSIATFDKSRIVGFRWP